MADHAAFLLLGLGNGATFAALALALVLTYRSSGVINFAVGAIALYTAYTYSLLRDGMLLNPLPGLPARIELTDRLPVLPAMAGALAIAATLGALLYTVVFRPLRAAPAVTKAVASLGVMLTMQALLAQRVGTAIVPVDPILPADVVSIGPVQVPGDRVWFAGIVLALGLALGLWFRTTRFGRATRAVAETEKGALVSGLSPTRIAFANWVLSGVLAGLGGILIAPIVPLSPSAYTLFIVPALAAALVARFSSLPNAVLAGLGIGMLQSELGYLQTQFAWLPQRGLAELVPLVLALVFLAFTGRPLPERGAVLLRNLGRVPLPRRVLPPAVLGFTVALGALVLTTGQSRAAVIVSLILAIIALSHVVVIGFAGQISLAQLSLAGVSAFSLSLLTRELGVPFPVALLASALVATLVGILTGLPALRLRGLPLAVVTLALAVALETLWFTNPALNGGASGATIARPSLFGIDLGVGAGHDYPRLAFGALCLSVLTLCALAVVWIRRSRLGGAMLAVRSNERSAAAAGVHVVGTKLVAFAISAFIAGLGGALLGYQQTIATPTTFGALAGLSLFAIVYLSGITSAGGALLAGVLATGGIFYTAMDEIFDVGGWYLVLSGIGLTHVAIRRPEGLVEPLYRLAQRRRARAAGPPLVAAATVPDEPRQRPARGGTLLALDGVGVRIGSVDVLSRVALTVDEGAIVGLIGPNGAGKTTLLDVVSGFTPATGTVTLAGKRLDGLSPHERAGARLGRTFQGLDLYDDLTVRENVRIGQAALAPGTRADRALTVLCGSLGITHLIDRPVRELPQGHRQLVSIARALAGAPRLLLLDEPAAGLDSTESSWLAERIRSIRDNGTTVLLVDHDMDLVLGLCDTVHVLNLGAVIASGPPAEIRTNPRVTAAYLGDPEPVGS